MRRRELALAIVGVLSFAAAQGAGAKQSRAQQIREALSAAPPAIAAHATVVAYGKAGRTVLRHGSNGWTCFPPAPDKSDPEAEPACFDANGLAFIEAFAVGRAPDPNKPGYSYMLQGGSAWSNTDPKATSLPRGRKGYIHIPPHFMILSAKLANESGLPLHQSDPNTHRPFVMFGGTPFALMIVPVK